MNTQAADIGKPNSIASGRASKVSAPGKRSRSENSLGPNEKIVLLALRNIGHESYGSEINSEIQRRIGESMKVGALYGTLDRLHRKGFVSHSENTSESSRRSNRQYFKLTGKGVSALEYSLKILDLMRCEFSSAPA